MRLFMSAPRLTCLILAFLWLADASVCSSLQADELFPPELTSFAPLAPQPVFTGAGPGHWDVRIRERGWVLRHGDEWRLYYTGYNGDRGGLKMLGLATSPDGITWTRAGQRPLYSEHWVEDFCIIPHEGTLHMFAEGFLDQVHRLTSTDGLTWTRQGLLDVRLTNGQPIPRGPFGTPTVWLEKGVWYFFYERRDAGIWLATSTDLKVWTNVQDEPVMVPGPADYDRDLIAMNQILQHQGKYYAIFHGANRDQTPNIWSTGIAVSDDLRHWTKFSKNPLQPTRENKSSGQLVPWGDSFRLYTHHDRVDVHGPVTQPPARK